MKSVLFLTPSFLPQLGGVEKHVAAISQVLSKRGWEVSVVTTQTDQDQPLEETLNFCKVIRIPLTAQENKRRLWDWTKRYIEGINPGTIIHVHDVGWWLLPLLIPSKRIKFSITFHGWEGQYPVRWQAKLHRLVISKLAETTVHVGGFIQHYYWDDPSAVTYGGVHLQPLKKITAPNLQHLKIIFIGRLEKENDIEKYILVLNQLAKLRASAEMTWVGDGSLKKLCQKWGRVTGMVDNPELYLKNADFVFASSYLSILEAQAVGNVVCALYAHPLKQSYLETFPGSRHMVISDNPEDLGNKIVQLANAAQRYTTLAKESHHFAQTQTWEKVANMYEELWNVA